MWNANNVQAAIGKHIMEPCHHVKSDFRVLDRAKKQGWINNLDVHQQTTNSIKTDKKTDDE
jgi:hypothetical protein